MGNCFYFDQKQENLVSSLTNDQGQKQNDDHNQKQKKTNDGYQNGLNSQKKVNLESNNFKENHKKRNSNNETRQCETISFNKNKSWEQQLEDKDYIMLIGCQGVGKSRLFKQMKLQEIQQSNNLRRTKSYDDLKQKDQSSQYFREGMLESKYVIVDTPSLQLQDDIDVREQVINKYQIYFNKRKHISHFGIVVNFERTDLMKSKVFQVLKFMRKFKDLISIIVVNMELSENEEEDKKNLEKSFKVLKLQPITFINNNMSQQDIFEQIKKIQLRKTCIDLKDTIFEEIKIEEQEKITSHLKALINQWNIRN